VSEEEEEDDDDEDDDDDDDDDDAVDGICEHRSEKKVEKRALGLHSTFVLTLPADDTAIEGVADVLLSAIPFPDAIDCATEVYQFRSLMR
jgi:hypothetical protein